MLLNSICKFLKWSKVYDESKNKWKTYLKGGAPQNEKSIILEVQKIKKSRGGKIISTDIFGHQTAKCSPIFMKSSANVHIGFPVLIITGSGRAHTYMHTQHKFFCMHLFLLLKFSPKLVILKKMAITSSKCAETPSLSQSGPVFWVVRGGLFSSLFWFIVVFFSENSFPKFSDFENKLLWPWTKDHFSNLHINSSISSWIFVVLKTLYNLGKWLINLLIYFICI